MQHSRFQILSLLAVLLLLSACGFGEQAGGGKLALIPTTYDRLQGWGQDNHLDAVASFARSCGVLLKKTKPKKRPRIFPDTQDWQEPCEAVQKVHSRKDARAFFENYFIPFTLAAGTNTDGLITGYFIPALKGSRTRSELYSVPVYGLPPDRKEGTAYLTRREIASGALQGRGLEIAWVADAVDLFFVEVQGSGQIMLEEGGILPIGFAGKNNRAYTAIGKVMVEKGLLPKENVSMQSIKAWLKAHPQQAQTIMNRNASFVFFKETPTIDAIGAQGVPLTPLRSIAVDSGNLAYGLPVYVATTLPDTPVSEHQPFRHLVIAQDTGGAIKGAVRADMFFGAGDKAAWLAGYMKQRGEMTLLIPNGYAGHAAAFVR